MEVKAVSKYVRLSPRKARDMARAIQGLSVAEALKVPRLLEVCPQHPNVVSVGGKMGEAFFQPNFEKLVRQFWEETA